MKLRQVSADVTVNMNRVIEVFRDYQQKIYGLILFNASLLQKKV